MNDQKYLANHYKGLGLLRNDFRNYNLTNLIVSKIKRGSVLDIGCGNGHLLSLLKKRGFAVYGIEPNQELIKLAKGMDKDLQITNGYAEHLAKIRRKFDNITMIDVLEHIKEDEQQVKMVYDHLKPHGQIILVIPAFQFLYGKRDKSGGHYRRYSVSEIERKLTNAGFAIKLARYWNMLGFFPYLISEKVLRKELNSNLRTDGKKGILSSAAVKMLNCWFKYIENNLRFGFGLSLLCIAEKR